MNDLLPPNSTELERHLAKARSKEIDLEERLNVLINIDSVPDQFLNFLAIQHSVDYWRDDWSPFLKRVVLKQSFNRSVHDKFHRILVLSGFFFLKIASTFLNSSFFPKPIKRRIAI